MIQIKEKYQTIFTRVLAGLAVLLGLFLLVATMVKVKEYRFVGSGLPAGSTISVSGKGEINRAPDTAKISFTVSDEQKILKNAQDNVSKKIDLITKELKDLGIEDKNIKTNSYNSYPQYDYPNTSVRPGSPVLRGYRVSHSLTVNVKALEKVSEVIAVLGNNNTTDISGPNFGFEDDKEVAREARDIAIEDAKKEAEKLAKSLGVKLVRIVSFNENSAGGYVVEQAMRDSYSSNTAASSSGPVLPVGENSVKSNVTLVYEIQ